MKKILFYIFASLLMLQTAAMAQVVTFPIPPVTTPDSADTLQAVKNQAITYVNALWSLLYVPGGTLIPPGNTGATSVYQRPLVGVIGHSYASNMTNKQPVYEVSKSGGVVTLDPIYTMSLTSGAPVEVQGCGVPYDQPIVALASASGSGYATTYTYGISDKTTGSTVFPTNCTIYSLGQSSVFGGYDGTDYLEWANIALGDVFDHPRSYVLNFTGGGFLPQEIADPGFVGQALKMSQKSPLPSVVVVDLGINDCAAGDTPAQIIPVIRQGMQILNGWTRNVIFMLPRPSNKTTPTNAICSALDQALLLGAAHGDWYVDDTRKRLTDPTSSAGAFLAALTSDGVHTNSAGAMQDGQDFANKFSFMFPGYYTTLASQTDAYSTSNPQGDLVGGFPLASTAGSINLTSSNQTIGPFQISIAGAGSSTGTAIISARTDTFPDGTTVPGNELVLAFSSGSGSKVITVIYGTQAGPASVYGPALGGTSYAAGQSLWYRYMYEIDSTSITGDSVMTTCVLQEVAGLSQWFGVVNDSPAQTGFTVYNGVMTSGIFTAQPNSSYLLYSCNFTVSGTVSGTPTLRIRDMGIFPNTSLYPKVF